MKNLPRNPLLGAHMSIADGPKNALIKGEKIGCTAIQIFTANNRQWALQPIKEKYCDEYLTYKKQSSIRFVMSHASYLINLGSPKPHVATKSINALQAELYRCDQLEIPFTVIHPGSRLDSTENDCLLRIAENLSTALEGSSNKCMVLLETMAGQGSSVGHTLEQLATIYKNVTKKAHVGICLDTCHIFAAGYNVSHENDYNDFWKKFDTTIGIKKLKAIHLNDSKKECGSCVDRHEHIGSGKIGLTTFKLIMNDKRFVTIPKILETPKDKSLEDDIKNLATLKSLID